MNGPTHYSDLSFEDRYRFSNNPSLLPDFGYGSPPSFPSAPTPTLWGGHPYPPGPNSRIPSSPHHYARNFGSGVASQDQIARSLALRDLHLLRVKAAVLPNGLADALNFEYEIAVSRLPRGAVNRAEVSQKTLAMMSKVAGSTTFDSSTMIPFGGPPITTPTEELRNYRQNLLYQISLIDMIAAGGLPYFQVDPPPIAPTSPESQAAVTAAAEDPSA